MKNKIHTLTLLFTLGALLLSGCSKNNDLDIVGTWKVNPGKTVDQAVATGLLPEDQKEKMKERFVSKADRYVISLTKEKIITTQYEAAYQIQSQAESEVVIQAEIKGTPVTMTFTQLDGGSAQIKSSATNDMDHLVWDKASEGAPKKEKKSEVDKDSAGKTPFDYAEEYYAAINGDDIEAIKALYTKGLYSSIVTKRGFLKEPKPELFEEKLERKMFKHSEYILNPEKCDFHKTNADGVFSVCGKVIFTEEYRAERKAKSPSGMDFPHINDEVCFRLEDGVWRITDKTKGQ